MKRLSLFRISAIAAAIVFSIATAWSIPLAGPIEAAPLLMPLIAIVFAPLVAALAWSLDALVQVELIAPSSAMARAFFPAPQTGEPQVTAFA